MTVTVQVPVLLSAGLYKLLGTFRDEWKLVLPKRGCLSIGHQITVNTISAPSESMIKDLGRFVSRKVKLVPTTVKSKTFAVVRRGDGWDEIRMYLTMPTPLQVLHKKISSKCKMPNHQWDPFVVLGVSLGVNTDKIVSRLMADVPHMVTTMNVAYVVKSESN